MLAKSGETHGDNGSDSDTKQQSKGGIISKAKIVKAMKVIIDDCSDDDGWAYLGEVGKRLSKRLPDFDTRNYGYNKLTPFVASLKDFDIQSRKTNNPNVVFKYIKPKKQR